MASRLVEQAPPVSGRLGEVETHRLRLSPVTPASVDDLEPVFAKPEVWRFPYGRGRDRAETEVFVASQVEHWAVLGFGLWTLSEHGSDKVLGYAGLAVPTFLPEALPAVEVGWRLDPDVWGRGYATEAGTAALEAAFGVLGLGEVLSLPQTANYASVKVARRLGMRERGTAVVPPAPPRGSLEVAVMVMTKQDWEQQLALPKER
ncbi:MAG TPA: GNAT family N-acetyltransferase [Acidimicrobiales bacterium]|nr:GNAT family N-acetyltransferase [Acidimicrobiales bacterium]